MALFCFELRNNLIEKAIAFFRVARVYRSDQMQRWRPAKRVAGNLVDVVDGQRFVPHPIGINHRVWAAATEVETGVRQDDDVGLGRAGFFRGRDRGA